MSGIPRGVGAPPPPGMDAKRGKLMCIKVRMLDDSVAVFHLGHKALGQTLLEEVSRHLNLLENDYFGLEFIDSMNNRCWLDKDKPILRQITATNSDAKFYFIVKFYTPNPIDLEEEYTRYLITLQIRRDLSLGELHCAESTAALLSAYLVQSDCGDFSSEDYRDATYLSHSRFVPGQTLEFQQKVMENHRNLVGMSPGESDLALLEVARRCDFYGIKFHPAKDIEGTQACLSVMHLGIKVFHQLHCVSTFSWAKIRKLSFKRRKLLIKLHPDSHQYYKETIEFVFDTRNECKNFWKKCVEHHAFFRCTQSDANKKDGKLFSKGSSFRYNGRTQKQLIDYVREHHKRREPFTRPLRSAGALRGYSTCGYSTVSDRRREERRNHTLSMPHLAHNSAETGTLDARTRRISTNYPSEIEQRESRKREHNHNQYRPLGPTDPKEPQENPLSLSLPNVLTDEIHVVCKELIIDEPPKSASGDNFLDMTRTHNDYDNVSEDSYRLSDNERFAKSDVGIVNPNVYNTTFTAKRIGNVVVKRVVSHCKSTPTNTDDEDFGTKSESAAPSVRKKIKEYPFNCRNMVPIEIDGPNVDLSQRRSTMERTPPPATSTSTNTMYSSSGAVIVRPKVISTDRDAIYATVKVSAERKSSDGFKENQNGNGSRPVSMEEPVYSTYGATGPLPGKVISKENMIITPNGVKEKKPKPAVPPKPFVKPMVPPHGVSPPAPDHPIVNLQKEQICARSEEIEKPERRIPMSRPALISVQSEDSPDIQKCHLYTSDIPYTLTLRNVDSSDSLPFSTFKESYETSSLKRTSNPKENFARRKSLELVPRKRLPSPGNFSSQDHTINTSNPEGDVLEYILRRRSMSHERSALSKKGRRGDPRRQTQPVRFDLPPSPPCSHGASGSTPFISFLPDDVTDDCVSESKSLHDDMDRLDAQKSQASSSFSIPSIPAVEDSDDSDPLPPPPPGASKVHPKVPPPAPPPKPAGAAERVVEIKASTVLSLSPLDTGPSGRQASVEGESPPYIDDSPKASDKGGDTPMEPTSITTPTGLRWTDF